MATVGDLRGTEFISNLRQTQVQNFDTDTQCLKDISLHISFLMNE